MTTFVPAGRQQLQWVYEHAGLHDGMLVHGLSAYSSKTHPWDVPERKDDNSVHYGLHNQSVTRVRPREMELKFEH